LVISFCSFFEFRCIVISAVIDAAIIDHKTDIKSPCEIHIADKNIKDKISMNIAPINKAQSGI
jgi:hypothetical protein